MLSKHYKLRNACVNLEKISAAYFDPIGPSKRYQTYALTPSLLDLYFLNKRRGKKEGQKGRGKKGSNFALCTRGIP